MASCTLALFSCVEITRFHHVQVNYADPAAAELEELGSESDAGGSGAASDASLPPAPSDSSSSGDSHGRRRRRPAPAAPGLPPAPGALANPAGVVPKWAAGAAALKPELARAAALAASHAGAQAGAPRHQGLGLPAPAPAPRPMVTGGRGGEPLRVCGLDEAQRRHFLQASHPPFSVSSGAVDRNLSCGTKRGCLHCGLWSHGGRAGMPLCVCGLDKAFRHLQAHPFPLQ